MAEAHPENERDNEILTGMVQLLEEGYLKDNPPLLQRLVILAYGELVKGRPVGRKMLSEAMGLDIGEIDGLFERIPSSAIECADGTTITGLIGLSIAPNRHQLIVADRTLYTWCALDALFLPAILDQRATIRSICPTTSLEIEIDMGPNTIHSAKPANAVMSIVSPEKSSYRDDLQRAFCCHVNFFYDRGAFDRWAEKRSDVKCVELDQAFELARMRNRRRFPDIPRLSAN